MSSIPDSPRRNVVLVTIDIIASVALLLFATVLALTVVGYAVVFGNLTEGCGAGPFDGLECNSAALSVAVYGLIGVTIISYFLGIGLVIVALIRKKITFWWPLGAVILIIVSFYAASWIAGMVAPSGVGS